MRKTNKIIIHSLSHFFLFGVVIIGVGFIKQPTATTPATTTQPVSKLAASTAPEQKRDIALANSAAAPSPAATIPQPAPSKQLAQPEVIYRIFAAPNDPRYNTNWALAKVNAPAAWNITTGSGQTVVAVIDTGFALNHEDLTDQWYTNAGETGTTQSGGRCWTGTPQPKQSNNCDDDVNGYVDDWRGWNFVLNDNNPQTGREVPEGEGVQHGTEVSGIVGATGNNGTGMTAINWNTKIMPLQALDDTGTGYTSDITAAVYYAVNNGAHVINLSLGAFQNDPALKAAVNYATTRNVVIVAASGNCGDSSQDDCVGISPSTVAYPAAYPDVIAVGATTASDHRASFSSYGSALDLSAPGYALTPSTSWSASNQTSLYSGTLYGTSFASPQVASLAALIKSIRPNTSVSDVTALLDATTTKVSEMNGLFYTTSLGHGVINAGSALLITSSLNSTSSTPALLQAGSYRSEHDAPTGATIGSGCQAANGACTVQITGSSGYKRFLPYTVIASGSAGWSWLADSLESDLWEIRTRIGEAVSPTTYLLMRK